MNVKQWLILSGLILVIPACGSVDDIRDTTNTVDQAVELLDDLDQNGAWHTISDGLDALDEYDGGYTATITALTVDNEQEPINTTIRMRVDGQHTALAQITQDSVITHYYFRRHSETGASELYRIEDNDYFCVTEPDHPLYDSVRSLFTAYQIDTSGARHLAVVEEDGDGTITDRDTTHYKLESRFSAAVDILNEFDNPELQAQVDQTVPFELTGSLDIDQDTGALLHMESSYTSGQNTIRFSFEITQFGDIDAITLIPDTQFVDVCE